MLDKSFMTQISIGSLFPDAKKKGQTWKMLCPFHQEKTPSFVIYPEDGRFHCFGCHEGGSYIDYVTKKGYAASFKEAVNYLRSIAGLPAIEFSKRDKSLEINTALAGFYYRELYKNEPALEYLKKRGITEEDIKKFRLGYAGSNAKSYLSSVGYSTQDIQVAGLLPNGKILFRERIIFPIAYGKDVYGFSARTMNGSLPKYINSPETPAFKKSRLLYGLFPQSVKSWGYAIIVEGYTDAISMHRIGFDNTVSVMGTAFTPAQAETLKRYTSEVVLLFDGDNAGKQATERAIGILIGSGMRVRIAMLNNSDPDSFIQQKGKDAADDMAALIDESEAAAVYLLKNNKSRKTEILVSIASTQDFPVDILPYISKEEWPIVQELSARTIADMLRTTGKLIYRKDKIEIRQWFSLLLVYYDNQYLFCKITNTPEIIHKEVGIIADKIRKNFKKEVKA